MICGKIIKSLDGQHKLLRAVRNNDIRSIEKIVERNEHLLSVEYENHPILILACNDRNVTAATITKLIELGASCTKPTKNDHWEAIHYAAILGDKEKLGAIIRALTVDEANSLVYCSTHLPTKKSYSNNALNILLKYGSRGESFLECCQLLIDKGVDIYQADSNGVTPHDLLKKEDKVIAFKAAQSQQNRASKEKAIFEHVRLNEEKEFLMEDFSKNEVNDIDGLNENLASCTLLQMCCAKGLTSCVKYILDKGASPNKTIEKNRESPIMIAIKEDHEEIVELLLNIPGIQLPEDILIKLQIKYEHLKQFIRIDDKYLTLILNHLAKYEKSVSRKYLLFSDELDRTALHYATFYRSSENVLKLLEMGAPLTRKDLFGHTPLHLIEPNVFEKFLDSCIALSKDTTDIDNMLRTSKEKFSIEINYEKLTGRTDIAERIDDMIERSDMTLERDNSEAHESEFLYYLIKIKDLTHLMNHPVVSCYLTVKWTKFKWAVYINLLMYFIAYVSLLFYGFAYNDLTLPSNTFLLVTLLLIFFRESIQLSLFRTDYLKRVDNIVDLILIAGIIYIIAAGWVKKLDNQNLRVAYSVVFLSSTLGIFMQLGNLPFFAIKVIILRQTAISFFKHMIFYVFPILAFFFCFYMLRESPEGNAEDTLPKPSNTTLIFNKFFFQTLYDVTTMFAGDPDSNYPDQFTTNPIFSHIIYVCFIVLIGIILQNLLIGLAVSDLQEIQKQAQFIGEKETAGYITNMERIIFSKFRESTYSFARSIFQKLLRAGCVFQDEAVLVIQPYNKGCVYVKKNLVRKHYIKDQSIIDLLQNIFKDLTLIKDKELDSSYSLKALHEKLVKIESILERLDVNHLLKK